MSDNEVEVLDESLPSRCAAVLLESPDISIVRLAQHLNISRHRAKKLAESPAVQSQLKEVSQQILDTACNKFKGRMGSLEVLAYEALKQNLVDKRIEGVKLWAQLVGLADKKEVEQKDTQIIIQMPGTQQQPTDIVIDSEDA